MQQPSHSHSQSQSQSQQVLTTYITITGKTDGFGAQYHAMLSGIAFAAKHKPLLTYLHSPFLTFSHVVDVKQANEFIGIPVSSFLNIPEQSIIKSQFINKVHYCNSPSFYYTPSVLSLCRTWYYNTSKPKIPMYDIVIHIRRGDVTEYNHSSRYISNQVYKELIDKVQKQFPSHSITIFSEGNLDDFQEFNLPSHCFQLNTDIFETFHSMVTAKVLIQSCSSFSYCAGLLNKNMVYHWDTFWHYKLNHWFRVSTFLPSLLLQSPMDSSQIQD